MKHLRILYLILTAYMILSCQDDWSFSADSRYMLGFSADTVKLDTVFTGVSSASAKFMIYNANDEGLRFDAVMGGGAASPFRINLDGEGGSQILDLEIAGGDSLFCYVSVNIPQTEAAEPFFAFDSVRFVLESGNVQYVRLAVYGQNAVRLMGTRIEHDTLLTARLPFIIYDSLYVADGATLTLAPGTRLYFHNNAMLDVAGRIVAQGSADSVILMRGDRLDDMNTTPPVAYDLLSDQWGGIRLKSGSYGNVFNYCDIHGGKWGITADSASAEKTKFSMYSSIVHNMKGNCIETTGCMIDVVNSQITNAGASCVDIAGGKSDFTFCTIAAFSLWSVANQAVLLSDRRASKTVPFVGASFRNCIITGRHASEFTVNAVDSVKDSLPYSVSNSLLMVKDTTDTRFNDVVFENSKKKVYGALNFENRTVKDYSSVFRLDSLSLARGIADTLSVAWPIDLAGVSRPPAGADAGCYQYHIPEKQQ